MTWLGDASSKIGDKQKAALEDERNALIAQLKALKAKGPSGKHQHNARHHQEDLIEIATKIKKVNRKLGRPEGQFE